MSRFPAGLLIALTAVLFLLGLSTIIKADHILHWQISILATEYGHWWAVACGTIALGIGVFRLSAAFKRTMMVGLLIAGLLFARPVTLAWARQSTWAHDLQTAFNAEPRPLLSLTQLWRVKREPPFPFETILFTAEPNELSLDFYRASNDIHQPSPWILVVHGGGWDSGSREQLPELNWHLARRGISVVTPSYRLAPQYRWPAQREDVLKTVAYVKNHAKELNVDPNRWVILGRSAGGQIAEAVAYQVKDATLKGVIAYHAPADMDFAYKYAKDRDIINSKDLLIRFLGGDPVKASDNFRDASPIHFVHKNAPPTLLFHGTSDPLTWVLQSRRLHAKLLDVGAKSVYLEFPWATHAFDFNLNGPGGQAATAAVDYFLGRVL